MSDNKEKAIKNLTPSYTQQWGDITSNKDADAGNGMVNVLGSSDLPYTAAHINEMAAREQPKENSITGPQLGGSKKGGGSTPKQQRASAHARQMSLEEQIAQLVAQTSAQQAAQQTAPTAVNPDQDQYAYQAPPPPVDPYAGLGDVNDVQMGDPRLARR